MSKGKATRSSTATSSTPAPAPAISNDILPGRFTEHEWNTLVEIEDGEELVFELVDTIVTGVLNVIHERHMDENLVPFSLNWAEEIMEDVINWQFLMHDPGECSTDPADWQPDDEPVRPPLDSWGRGSVPSRIVEIPVEEEEGNLVEVEKMKPPLNLADNSSEEEAEVEDLESIRNNPDLHKLNKLREHLKYFKINEDDMTTLKKIEKPDDSLHIMYQALGLIQGIPDNQYKYDDALSSLDNTKGFIENYGPRPLENDTLLQLKRFVEDIKLHPDHVTQLVTPAAAGLCTWIHSAYTYQTLCNVLNVETTIDLSTLKHSLIEIKSLGAPPTAVKDVMCAVTSLLDGKMQKEYNVKYFANIPVTLNRLETFDGKNLSQKFIKKLKDAFMKYSTDELARVSMGCVYLYKWCEDQIYGSGSIIVRPPDKKEKKKKRRVVNVVQTKTFALPETEEPEQLVATSLTGSLNNMMPHQSAAIVKAQQGRPPGQKEVEYDEQGNVISVMKIKKLPSHRVKTKFEIIDPLAQSNKKHLPKNLKPLKGTLSLRKTGSSGIPAFETQDHTPIPPSFVDAVTASPGVVIKQGSRIKRGPDSVILSPIEQSNTRLQQMLSSN